MADDEGFFRAFKKAWTRSSTAMGDLVGMVLPWGILLAILGGILVILVVLLSSRPRSTWP